MIGPLLSAAASMPSSNGMVSSIRVMELTLAISLGLVDCLCCQYFGENLYFVLNVGRDKD